MSSKQIQLFLIIFALVLWGCKPEQDTGLQFEQHVKAKVERISDDIGFEIVSDFFVYKDYLVVISHDEMTDAFVHVFNKKTGKKIHSTLFYGRAQNEALMCRSSFMDYDRGIVYIYDQMKKALLSIDLDTILQNNQTSISSCGIACEISNWVTSIVPSDIEEYLIIENPGLNVGDSYRFKLIDDTGNILSQYNDFPILREEERFDLYNYSKVSMSPDKTTLVVGTSFGSILEIFDVKDKKISLKHQHIYINPDLTGGLSTCTIAFNDIHVNDTKIYTIYDGNVKVADVTDPYLICRDIAIWDLNGNPKLKIQTDQRLEQLYYSEKEDMIYAISQDVNGTYLTKVVITD